MSDFEPYLKRWQDAGVIDSDAATRIRAYEAEQKKPTGLRWQGLVALILGAILLACGVVLFVNAHWDEISPFSRLALVLSMVSVFHLGGAMARRSFHSFSTTLHAIGTISVGAAIALVGQIFNIQEHWPAAILMWAIAALAGWALLRDQAQQTLTLLLFPAWIISEWSYAAEGHVGQEVYIGRILVTWGVLYLATFVDSKRRIVHGVLFAAAAIASLVGTVLLLDGWRSGWGNQGFVPRSSVVWGWIIIAGLPLFFAVFRIRKMLLPVGLGILFALALPWCTGHIAGHYGGNNYTYQGPNLLAHALVAAYSIFLSWWGVRQSSRSLVNLGIVGFAVAVAWFYFSDLFDKMGRSLGLISLGILFLAGGWALEKTRRRLIAHIGKSPQEAAQ